ATLASLASIEPGVLVSDLVGRPEQVCSVARCYAGQGFGEYERLVRLARGPAKDSDTAPNSDVAAATVDDVRSISQFLEERLDPLVDRIPTVRNLEAAAKRGGILVVWRNAAPAGVLIFENSNLSATLRYWYVDGGLQGQGIGSSLMNAF